MTLYDEHDFYTELLLNGIDKRTSLKDKIREGVEHHTRRIKYCPELFMVATQAIKDSFNLKDVTIPNVKVNGKIIGSTRVTLLVEESKITRKLVRLFTPLPQEDTLGK